MDQLTKVVIKVGSNVLTKEDGLLNLSSIQNITKQIAKLKARGVEVVLVSSGAVASGRELIKLGKEEDSVSRRQILASIGQARLMHIYYEAFEKVGLNCAQVLVSKEDFRDRRHYKNMQNCLFSLNRNSVIPVVNENDVVSITELMFTDNDELAGMLTSMTNSEALIILTNVDGVYDKSPLDSSAKLIKKISYDKVIKIDEEKSKLGRGGMKAKLSTAQKLASLGVDVFIGNGFKDETISSIFDDGFEGTHIVSDKKVSESVRWVAHNETFSISKLIVNDDLAEKLANGEKEDVLLEHIVSVDGDFFAEDVVKITDKKSRRLGVGMVLCDKENFFSEKVLIKSNYMYLNIVQ